MKVLNSIYEKSPMLIQNVLLSLYSFYLNYRDYGPRFKNRLQEFKKMQWWDEERLVGYQNERLRELIRFAYENVPYYENLMKRERLRPQDIESKEDLKKLPVLTRNDLKKKYDALFSRKIEYFDRLTMVKGHTSGTTGSPVEFLWDMETCAMNNAAHWRQKSWAGLRLHDRCAVLLGRTIVPIENDRPPFWRNNYLHNTLWLSSFHMTKTNLSLYMHKLREYQPKYIEGYPSTLFVLAKFLESVGETLPLKAALTSSETLYPIQRETIERSFDCKVFDYYGLAERVVFATECEKHEGHHVNMDYGITEIVNNDGLPVQTGELGWIVGTGLYNYAMPLIRYKTNDAGALKEKRCSCGRNFPLLEDVTTKAEDIITTADGRFISPSVLTHPFKPIVNIVESQIIQEDVNNLRIKIVRGPGYSNSDTASLLQAMQRRLGAEMQIHIEFVQGISRNKIGKFRWVISKVPLRVE